MINNLNKNNIYVIAVSTGVDSMVLLDLAIKNNLNFVVAHVNHNKRESSIKEESFIKEYCLKHNITLEILQFNYKENNFQNEARVARYNFFYNVAIKHNCNVILTAHHSYDNVESILINILRGSNLKGYSGINNSFFNNIEIQRPLLNFNKNEIYNYAHINNISFFEDESNNDESYLRNNIRKNILPKLENINNNFDKKFIQYSNLLNESFDFIRSTSLTYINNDIVDLNIYKTLHTCIQKDIINYLFEKYNLTNSNNKINDCINLLLNNKPNQSYNIYNNYRLVKEYNTFYITNKISKQVLNFMGYNEKCEIPMYGTFYLSNIVPKDYTYITKICYNSDKFPLKIRTRLNGDKVQIKNGHKKVSNLFTDLKVPKEKRDEILLVENNNNEIIWIIDYYKLPVKDEEIYLVYKEKNYE